MPDCKNLLNGRLMLRFASLIFLTNEKPTRDGHGKTSVAVGAFMRPVSIHTGAWRYPGAWRTPISIWAYQTSDPKLEAGKFDASSCRHLAVPEHARSMRKAQPHRHVLRTVHAGCRQLAAATERIGLIATGSNHLRRALSMSPAV